MKKQDELKQACRYTYQCYPALNIKQCLDINPWLFNQAYSIMAFYDTKTKIPMNVFKAEQNWVTDNFVLFSGANDEYENYDEKIDWDSFGTWLVYLYPAEIKSDKTKIIGRDTFLERVNKIGMEEYFDLSENWKFIHDLQPDMFISRQKKGIMIGALSELNLMSIETK